MQVQVLMTETGWENNLKWTLRISSLQTIYYNENIQNILGGVSSIATVHGQYVSCVFHDYRFIKHISHISTYYSLMYSIFVAIDSYFISI